MFIRNITSFFGAYCWGNISPTGAVTRTSEPAGSFNSQQTGNTTNHYTFNANKVVPTGEENRPFTILAVPIYIY